MKIKPAGLLVVPLGKAVTGIPPSWCSRQMAAWQLLSELVISFSRDRRISMQQNIENKKNKKKTNWQLTKLLVSIGKFYCGFHILHLAFRLLVA